MGRSATAGNQRGGARASNRSVSAVARRAAACEAVGRRRGGSLGSGAGARRPRGEGSSVGGAGARRVAA